MNLLKSLPIILLFALLLLTVRHFLKGCSGPIVAEIAEGVTEGIIDEIEEYREHGHKNNKN